MSYLTTLSNEQKNNIAIIVSEAQKAGITNPYSLAGMLAIVSKESSFIPKSENLNYSATRLQEVFGLSSSRANELAGKPEAIANAVYGGKFGNAANEGWKYRGRGFNQLTFKANYEKYGNIIGEDIVSNPDKLNEVKTAAKVLIAYNKAKMEELAKLGKLKEYNATDINNFKNTEDATLAFYHITSGVGNSVAKIKALKNTDTLGGMKKALSRVNDLIVYTDISEKKSPLKTITLTALVVVATWVLIKYIGIGKKTKLLKYN